MIGRRRRDHGSMSLVGLWNAWRDAAESTSVLPWESPDWLMAVEAARERRALYDEQLDMIIRARRANRLRHPRPWARQG